MRRRIRRAWDWLLDEAIAAGYGIPRPPGAAAGETQVDRAIREEGERLRRAFAWLDERRRDLLLADACERTGTSRPWPAFR